MVGVQSLPPQTLGVPPPPQVWGGLHVPQLRVLPQPSPAVPQLKPSPWHVAGVHPPKPQTLGVPPPPHVSGDAQVPQLSVPPQPSAAVPQL